MPSTEQRLTGHGDRAAAARRLLLLDGYSTPAVAVRSLVDAERLRRTVWEPAAGLHAIADPLRERGHRVWTSDLRRWHPGTREVRDFFDYDAPPVACDLVTNPPYARLAQPFAEHALRIMPRGSLVCMLLKLQFLEGVSRGSFYERTPPARVHVFSFRLPRMPQFFYDGEENGGMLAFAWFVWEVGRVQTTELHWMARPEGYDSARERALLTRRNANARREILGRLGPRARSFLS